MEGWEMLGGMFWALAQFSAHVGWAQSDFEFQKFGPGVSPRDPARIALTLKTIAETNHRWRGFNAESEGSIVGDVLQVGAAAGSRVFAGETAQQAGDLVSGVFFFLTLRPGRGLDYIASGLNPLKYLNSAISDVGGVIKSPFIATGTPIQRISLATQELGQSGNLMGEMSPVAGALDPMKHVAIILDHGAAIVGHQAMHLDRPYATHPVYSATGASEWFLVEGLLRDSIEVFGYGLFTSNCGAFADSLLADFSLSSPEFVNVGIGGGDIVEAHKAKRAANREKFSFDMFRFSWVLQMAEFDDTPLESHLKEFPTSGSTGLVFQELAVAVRGGNAAFRKTVAQARVRAAPETTLSPQVRIASREWAAELLDAAQGVTFEGLTWAYETNRQFWDIAIAACKAVEYQHAVCFALVDQGPAVVLQKSFQWAGWENDARAIENRNLAQEVPVSIGPAEFNPIGLTLEPEAWSPKNLSPMDSTVAGEKLKEFSDAELSDPRNLLEVQNLLIRQLEHPVEAEVLKRYLRILPPASGLLAAIGLVQQGSSLKDLSFSEAFAFARTISFLPSWNRKVFYYSKLSPGYQDALAMDFFFLWPNAIHTGEEAPSHAGSVRLADRQVGLTKNKSDADRTRFVRAIRDAATKFEEFPKAWVSAFARLQ